MKKLIIALFIFVTGITGFSQDTYVMGILPLEDKNVMIKKFTPLKEYLEQTLEISITLDVPDSYDQFMKNTVDNKYFLAYMSPTTLLKARLKNKKIDPVCNAIKNGNPFYYSCICVKKDSPISSLKELSGKIFAFGDKSSTSSYLMPRVMLEKANVFGKLSKAYASGSHSKAVAAVLSGQADACGIKESVFEKNKDALKMLKKSSKIQEFPFCMDKDFATSSLGNAVTEALLQAGSVNLKAVQAINKDFEGFTYCSFKDFSHLFTHMKRFEML